MRLLFRNPHRLAASGVPE